MIAISPGNLTTYILHILMRYFDFRNEPWTQCVCISFLNLYKEIRPGNLTTSYETTVIDHDFKDENIFTLLIFKRHTIRLLSLASHHGI
jgi:hypothetical protein